MSNGYHRATYIRRHRTPSYDASVTRQRVTLLEMADTLSIRLTEEDRSVLSVAAARRGIGISALIRELAHAEAGRLRRGEIRAQGERFMVEFDGDPGLVSELDDLGSPQAPHPDAEAWWPAP
jgi:hypothetical protein